MTDAVYTETNGSVCTIILNRPDASRFVEGAGRHGTF